MVSLYFDCSNNSTFTPIIKLKTDIMKISSLFGLVALLMLFLVSSCLTCETKEYTYAFTGKGKGTLTVKYNNILSKYSEEEDGLTQLEELNQHYDELINDYIKGDQLVSAFPNAKLSSKRLFEENGKLCGEAIYEFSSAGEVHLFQTDTKGPYMYLLNSMSFETVSQTNGKEGPEYFSVIYWSNKLKKLSFSTKVEELDETMTSLLAMWKSKQK